MEKSTKKVILIATAVVAPLGFMYLGYLFAKFLEKKVNTREDKQYNK